MIDRLHSTGRIHAWARLDVTKAGPFFFGNTIIADGADLRIAVVNWSESELVIEVNNPSDRKIVAPLQTAPGIKDRLPVSELVELPRSSTISSWK